MSNILSFQGQSAIHMATLTRGRRVLQLSDWKRSVTQCCCVRRNVSHQYSNLGNPQQNVLRRFVLPHLVSSTQEVNIVFDSPQPHSQSPKAFQVTNALPSDHKHTHFTNCMAVPTKLRENLSCRTCKRQLVE